jgi:hypothetical protein
MANLVAKLTIAAKYCRDERWDIFSRLFQQVALTYLDRTGKYLTQQALVDALIKAGSIEVANLIAGKPPRYSLRQLTKIGYPYVVVAVYEDDTVIVGPVKEECDGTKPLVPAN